MPSTSSWRRSPPTASSPSRRMLRFNLALLPLRGSVRSPLDQLVATLHDAGFRPRPTVRTFDERQKRATPRLTDRLRDPRWLGLSPVPTCSHFKRRIEIQGGSRPTQSGGTMSPHTCAVRRRCTATLLLLTLQGTACQAWHTEDV